MNTVPLKKYFTMVVLGLVDLGQKVVRLCHDASARSRRSLLCCELYVFGKTGTYLPVEQPTKFELVINLTTGPPSLLARPTRRSNSDVLYCSAECPLLGVKSGHRKFAPSCPLLTQSGHSGETSSATSRWHWLYNAQCSGSYVQAPDRIILSVNGTGGRLS